MNTHDTDRAIAQLTRQHNEENVYGVLAALDLLGVISLEKLPLSASVAGRAMGTLRRMAQAGGSGPIQTQEQTTAVDPVVPVGSCIDPLPDGDLVTPRWLDHLVPLGVEQELIEELWCKEGGAGHLYRQRLRKNHRVFAFLVQAGRIKNPGGFLRRAITGGWLLSRSYQPGYVRPQEPQEGPCKAEADPVEHERVSGLLTGFLEQLRPGRAGSGRA